MSDPASLSMVNPERDVVLAGPVYNEIVRRLNAGELRVEPPLSIQRDASGGTRISVTLSGEVSALRLDNRDGNGFYDGRAFMGSTTNITSPTNALSLPAGLTDPNSNDASLTDALVFNPAESAPPGGTSSAAALNPTPANPLWGAGLKVGVTTEAAPRGVYMWLTGNDVGTPQYAGQVLMGVGNNQRAWDFPRAHGAL
jgi:hypothetical protein